MAQLRSNIRELRSGQSFSLAAGENHRLIVDGFRGLLVEMEDLNFNFDSAVMLPEARYDNQPGTPANDRITGLAVLRTCLLQVQEAPDYKILIAGHTDRIGTPEYNLVLSQQRADNVLAALTGDATSWAKLADKKHRVMDYQQILRWVVRTFGWDCSPGAVDDVDGPNTQAAVKNFQMQYNDEFSKRISVDGVVGPQTWGAFLDLYDRELATLLEIDASGLRSLRSGLNFVGPRTVGCGLNHPYDSVAHSSSIAPGADRATTARGTSLDDAVRGRQDRRVDILLFKPEHLPVLDCHPAAGRCNPAVCEIYQGGSFKLEYLPSDPALGHVIFRIRRLVDGSPAAGVIAVIETPDGTRVERPTDEQGNVRMRATGTDKFKLVRVIDDKQQHRLTSVSKATPLS